MKKTSVNSKSDFLNRSKIVSNLRTTPALDKLPESSDYMYDNLPDFKLCSSGFIDMSASKKALMS